MSSSTLPPQEVEVPSTDLVSPAQSTESNVSIAVSDPASSDTITPNLGNGLVASTTEGTPCTSLSSSSVTGAQASPACPPPTKFSGNSFAQQPVQVNAPCTSSDSPDLIVQASPSVPPPPRFSGNANQEPVRANPPCTAASSSPGVLVPASPAPAPPPRFPGNNAAQDHVRANLPNAPAYTVPASGFSYNVFPRNNSPSGAPQRPPNSQTLNLINRVSPAALQPPVPGLPIAMRPSFSYNIISHASPIPAPGQQFQPVIVQNQAFPRGGMLSSQETASSHSSHSMQPQGSNPNVTRAVPENLVAPSQLPHSLAKGQASAPSFPAAGNSQTVMAERKDVSSGANASASLMPAQTGQGHLSSGLNSTPVAAGNLNPTTLSSPGGPTFSRPPGATRNTVMQNALPACVLPTPAVTLMPSSIEASGSLQKIVMSAPSSSGSFQPIMQNVPQQMNQHHSSYPAVAPPSQPHWLPQIGGMPRPTFVPYSGPPPASYPLPMHSVPPFTVLHPPGVPVMVAPTVSLPVTIVSGPGPGLSTAKSPPTGIDHDKQSPDPVHNEASKKIDADVWTAHKTDTGAIYYYNSVTGESTYEKPASFMVEADKVTAQPTPVSWEKLPGTDWALVTTDDGKKYYCDMKNKISSWQIPHEVAEVLKNQENDATLSTASPNQSVDKSNSTSLSTPALQTGGRDATSLRASSATVSSSALDLVKKKLQDASMPISSTPLPVSSALVGTAPDSQKIVENSNQIGNGDANLSESSSDSEDTDSGPTKEECLIQFKEMLKERGIAPFSKWEKELPKIVFDPRFKAVPGYAARRSLFEHYVRTRADEERKEKKAAQKAAIDSFKHLLDEASEDINLKTDYSTFKRKWSSDPRFLVLDRKEKEQLLNERVLSLKRVAEETRAASVSDFKSMLKEKRDITAGTRWSRVKDFLRSDPRYKIIKHEEREVLFNEYLLELKAAEVDAEKAEKSKREEQDKLKRREQETRKRKQREEQEMESLRLKVRRKEAEASFQALLVETIKDPKASWTESKPKLEKDPQGRFTNSGLELVDMEKLFREHTKLLFERCVNDFRALLNDVITVEAASNVNDSGKSILTSWSEAKALLKADARYSRLSSKDRENLWRKYADEIIRKQKGTSNPARPDVETTKNKSSADQVGRSPRNHRRR